MSRRAKLLSNLAIGAAASLLILVVVTIYVLQTGWFQSYVKQKIVSAAEESTGGRVEVGSITLDWRRLHAMVTDFVIHGNEQAGTPPFFRVGRAEVNLRLFTGLRHAWNLTYLGIDRPEANIVVFPDGRTNVPTPKHPSNSNTTALEDVVNLAVGHFELTNGLLTLNSQKQPLNVHAENLRAQLWYSALQQGYGGQLSLEPLYVISGRNTPVKFALTLPIALRGDRIDLYGGRISTAASQLAFDASVEDLRNLKTAAHVAGHIALADLKNAGDLQIALDPHEPLKAVDLDVSARIENNAIEVTGLHVGLGHSMIDGSGKLKDLKGTGSLAFKAQLALDELSRLAKVTAQPKGTVILNGTAKLDANNSYQVTGSVGAGKISFLTGSEPGARRIGGIDLKSEMHLDPHGVELNNFRLTAFGGELTGSAALEDFARYNLKGNLHLDLGAAARSMGQKSPTYVGSASGTVLAQGDLNTPGTKSLTAFTRLSIAPGTRGVPISGRVYMDYNGASDDLKISDSYIALPHSRVTLSGSLGNRLDVALTTRDLNDLLAAIPAAGKPVELDAGGQAALTATITGRLTSPHVSGHLGADRLTVQARHFDALALDANAASSGASLSNGSLRRGTMRAEFTGSVGLRDWTAVANSPVSGDVILRDGDLADIMVLAGRSGTDYSGALSATVHMSGTAANPLGSANLVASNGTIQGESFDQIQAQVNMADQLITISSAQAVSGAALVNLSADFQHPRDSLTTGKVHGRIQTSHLSLTQFRALQKQLPNTAGDVQLQAEAIGMLSETQAGAGFLLTAVSADASVRGLRSGGQNFGDLTASARTRQQTVHYDLTSDFAGSKISASGDTQLTVDYPTTAEATVGNLPIERLLALATRPDIPAKGSLSCTAHFSGTLARPQGNFNLDLANAVLYDEPLDHVRVDATYLDEHIDLSKFDAISGPSHISATVTYDHAAGNLQAGNLQFHVENSRIELARIRNVQKMRPGLGGIVQIDASGAGTVNPTGVRVQLRNLDANLAATGLAAQGKTLGDVKLTANTTGGRVNFSLDSNLAGSSIHGNGNAELAGDYPVNADLAFSDVAWTRVQAMLGSSAGEAASFEAGADGQATVSGPIAKIDDLRGSLKLTRLNLNTIAQGGSRGAIVIQNQGPIAMSIDRGAARIDSLHLTGPETDLQAHGTALLRGQKLDLTIDAHSNLAVIKQLNRDVVSSGSVALAATVKGTATQPVINGRLELHDASVAHTAFSNGISKANGVVQFNGNNASVQNLTAESGGGKIKLGGFVAYGDGMRFGLRANAAKVRIRPQEGISVALDANINLTGTPQASIVSGTATLDRLTYAPRSDFGSMLSRAAPPVDVAAAPSPLLDNMKLDIQVRTTSATAVRTSMAEGLQADANLRIRGTASEPGVLGRIDITQGQLVFFGSTYAVNTGTIGFYNPVRIAPVLNLSLKTQTKGVDVVLRVTGPVDNMKLSYTSDPPLQFQEIVALLASGKVPTSDPTLLANQPPAPTQSMAQMGESAVVGTALADPASSQLQRVFGVSQFKIDPTFAGGSELPQARMTLQQHVATNVTFTYVTDVDDPNTQIVRIEWAFNPQWSAIGMRDQNGIVSVRFAYKKQFR